MIELLIIFIAIFATIAIGSIIERKQFASIKQREALSKDIPILADGKTLDAFTIEQAEYISAGVVIGMNFFRGFWFKLRTMFGGSSTAIETLMEMARRETIVRLKEKAGNANYIVNIRIESSNIKKGQVEAFAYGTAIYLYEGSLGLYNIPEDLHIPAPPLPKRTESIKDFTKLLVGTLALIVLFYWGSGKLLDVYVPKVTPKQEGIIWSLLGTKHTLLKQRVTKPDLLRVEKKVQAILDKLPKTKTIKHYKFEAILVDKPLVNAAALPGGKIIVYKGLLDILGSENALAFVLGHELGHFEDRDHLKGLGRGLIGMMISMAMFGNDNVMTRFFAGTSDIINRSFSRDQELEADEFGLFALDGMYGHVGGAKEFFKKMQQAEGSKKYTNFLRTHPMSEERIENIERLIKENDFPIREVEPLILSSEEVEIEKQPVHKQKEITASAKFNKLYNEYDKRVSQTFNDYNNSIAFFNGILAPSNLGSRVQLEQNLKLLNKGFETIDKYKNYFVKEVKYVDTQIKNFLITVEDENQRRVFKSLWNKEKQTTSRRANFLFKRDKEILKTQEAAINFLYKRLGRYSTDNKEVYFSARNDDLNYQSFLDKIYDLKKAKPPKKVK